MATSKEILIQLKAENKNLKAKLNQSEKSINKFAKKSKSAFAGIGQSIGKAFIAFTAIFFVIKKIISVTDEQAQAEAQLNAVLESTGHAAGMSAEELKNMASELQAVTKFGDEAIIKGQALLLTFTKIGKDVMPQATETMLNMAEAMGTDLKTQAIMLGKALNDPIQGLSALRRVGVQLTADQELSVKQFMEINDIASAQKVILGELETQFGGVARASALTIGGGLTQLGNTIGDLVEDIGFKLQPAILSIVQSFSSASKSGGLLSETFGLIGDTIGWVLKNIATFLNAMSLVSSKSQQYYHQIQMQSSLELAMIAKRSKNIELMKKLMAISLDHMKKAQSATEDVNKIFAKQNKLDEITIEKQKEINKGQQKILADTKKITVAQAVPKKEVSAKDKDFETELKRQLQIKDQFENEWSQKLLQHQYTNAEIEDMEREKSLEMAEQFGYKKDEIERYWNDVKQKRMADNALSTLSYASSTIGQLGQLYAMDTQNKISTLNQKQQAEIDAVNNSVLSEEDKKAKIEKINAKYKKKEDKLKLKAWKTQQKLNMAQIAIETPIMAARAFSSMAWFYPAAVAAAAAATAFGMKKFQLTANQEPPVFKKGRIPMLQNGYIPDDHSLAYVGNREAVMTAEATRANYDLFKTANNTGERIQQSNIIRTTIPVTLNGQQVGLAVDEYRDDNSVNSGLENYASSGAY